VQHALAAALGETITADGILGKRSRAAIARWQAQIGAAPTGYLGAAQVERLLAAGKT
jgi:peptidoglycan hydrolase-like protein with peptidoglycan-binding domain